MSQKKKLTTNAGAPVVDNRNTMTVDRRCNMTRIGVQP
jgi:catalase